MPAAPAKTTDKTTTEKPAGAAPPEKKPAEKKAPTADNLAGIDQFLKVQQGGRYAADKPPADDKKPAEPKLGEDDDDKEPKDDKIPKGEKKATKEGDEKPAKPATKPPPARQAFKPKGQADAPPPTILTAEQIAEASAKGVAKAMAEMKPAAGKDRADPADAALTEEDRERVDILARMEEMHGEKYKGIAVRYKDSLLKLKEYADTWEKEHPGQTFDEDSAEHEEFMNSVDVDWNDHHFTMAAADIIAERKLKDKTKPLEDRFDKLDQQEELRQSQHEIVAEQNGAARSYWQQLGEEFADIIGPDGAINRAKIDQLHAADPEGWALRERAAVQLDAEIAELYKIFKWPHLNDPEKNIIHKTINQFAMEMENYLMAQPTQDRLNQNGQQFAPAGKYWRMPKAERAAYWTLSKTDIAVKRAETLAGIAKAQAEAAEEAHKRWARARGIQLEDPNEKPVSPAAGGESRMAAAAPPRVNQTNDPINRFVSKF